MKLLTLSVSVFLVFQRASHRTTNAIDNFFVEMTPVSSSTTNLHFSKKKRQFSIYKTCFDILMSSSVANELFNGCTFEFMLRYVAKLRVYNLNMKCEMRRKQK